ncbi:MAG: hypothetical protein WCP19_14820, partial [Chloroflexota bacterium]
VLLEHHPGPTAGACWVILPEPKIVFIGDLVVKNQPPFLANANLEEWIKSLDQLLAGYRDYTIVSGRSGVVTAANAQSQREKISSLHESLEALAKQGAGPDALESLIPGMMPGGKSSEHQKQYVQRLIHGLRHYYARHYKVTGPIDESEE